MHLLQKSGHVEIDCFIKHPEKRKIKKEQSIHNLKQSVVTQETIEVILNGTINGVACTNILFDTGAQLPAFNPRLVKDVKSVKQTKINCLSKHIHVGTFSVVQLPVSTSIYTGPLEGIVVQNLLYDAILPIMKSDTVKSIRVNLSSASIDVEPPPAQRPSDPACQRQC